MPSHSNEMETALTIALGIALAAVVLVLLSGVTLFAKGGEANRRWSLRLMNLRVATQAVAIALLGILMLLHSR